MCNRMQQIIIGVITYPCSNHSYFWLVDKVSVWSKTVKEAMGFTIVFSNGEIGHQSYMSTYWMDERASLNENFLFGISVSVLKSISLLPNKIQGNYFQIIHTQIRQSNMSHPAVWNPAPLMHCIGDYTGGFLLQKLYISCCSWVLVMTENLWYNVYV